MTRQGGRGGGGNKSMYVPDVDDKECSSILMEAQRLIGDPCNRLASYVCKLFLQVKPLCSLWSYVDFACTFCRTQFMYVHTYIPM